jgi:hypothetical protein
VIVGVGKVAGPWSDRWPDRCRRTMRAVHVGVLIEQHLPDDLLDRHRVGIGHAAPPFVEL